jgi:acetamidase/formamidase
MELVANYNTMKTKELFMLKPIFKTHKSRKQEIIGLISKLNNSEAILNAVRKSIDTFFDTTEFGQAYTLFSDIILPFAKIDDNIYSIREKMRIIN